MWWREASTSRTDALKGRATKMSKTKQSSRGRAGFHFVQPIKHDVQTNWRWRLDVPCGRRGARHLDHQKALPFPVRIPGPAKASIQACDTVPVLSTKQLLHGPDSQAGLISDRCH